MRLHRHASWFIALALVATACGDDDGDGDGDGDGDDSATTTVVTDAASVDATEPAEIEVSAPVRATDRTIRPGMTWTWQLQGDIDTSVDADVYDIDLFDVSADVIDELHADGRIVICYFSTAWEDWRDDASEWPTDVLGAPLDDWQGERWIDIRDERARAVLERRLDLAVEKRCDGVEPDNVTAYRNESGFDLTWADQLDFNRHLATAARQRGLSVALKNGLEQIPDLVDHFDFAVNEQCVQYDECDVYEPFVAAGKAVFGAEYSDEAIADPATVCAIAAASGVATLVLPVELDGSFRTPCE